MVSTLKDERILSIENKLNSLMIRLSDVERRLIALEQASGVSKPAVQTSRPATTNVEHKYLRRAIHTARRDYERKYR